MSYPKLLLSSNGVHRAISRIAHEIAERNENAASVVVVGIQRGGTHLAERLSATLEKIWNHSIPMGLLDVSMYRDDYNRRLAAAINPTALPFDVNGKVVVLVDDVLFSGRTIRAAMDALNDFGRPKSIQLAVLVDRGSRELPIKADFVGKEVSTALNERVDVSLKEDGGADTVHITKEL
jgi:pyrimidine operon attenuation protein/uracil phosphoribosyltransferase